MVKAQIVHHGVNERGGSNLFRSNREPRKTYSHKNSANLVQIREVAKKTEQIWIAEGQTYSDYRVNKQVQ